MKNIEKKIKEAASWTGMILPMLVIYSQASGTKLSGHNKKCNQKNKRRDSTEDKPNYQPGRQRSWDSAS